VRDEDRTAPPSLLLFSPHVYGVFLSLAGGNLSLSSHAFHRVPEGTLSNKPNPARVLPSVCVRFLRPLPDPVVRHDRSDHRPLMAFLFTRRMAPPPGEIGPSTLSAGISHGRIFRADGDPPSYSSITAPTCLPRIRNPPIRSSLTMKRPKTSTRDRTIAFFPDGSDQRRPAFSIEGAKLEPKSQTIPKKTELSHRTVY